MELTKRQEKQLNKVFNDPKKLRKWIDELYHEMIMQCDERTQEVIGQYLDIYGIVVAYTAHYVLGLGKKRLPEFMSRVWNNMDCLTEGYISFDDCIQELKENGIKIETNIIKHPELLKRRKK